MAIVKKKELAAMSEPELKTKLDELQKELMKMNAQIAMGTVPKSPGLVKNTKKTIAKIKMFLHQKNKNKKEEEKPEEKKKHG